MVNRKYSLIFLNASILLTIIILVFYISFQQKNNKVVENAEDIIIPPPFTEEKILNNENSIDNSFFIQEIENSFSKAIFNESVPKLNSSNVFPYPLVFPPIPSVEIPISWEEIPME